MWRTDWKEQKGAGASARRLSFVRDRNLTQIGPSNKRTYRLMQLRRLGISFRYRWIQGLKTTISQDAEPNHLLSLEHGLDFMIGFQSTECGEGTETR